MRGPENGPAKTLFSQEKGREREIDMEREAERERERERTVTLMRDACTILVTEEEVHM